MSNHKHQLSHSLYVYNKEKHIDVVLVKSNYKDDDGKIKPHLAIYKNPKRSFWVTKPAYRNHNYKKEYCDESELDRYTVYEKNLEHELFKVIHGFPPRKIKPRLKQICKSPYVYGADIRLETLIKRKYNKEFGDNEFIPFTKGFLDIETSVIPGNYGDINLISVTHETDVYVAINDAYLYKTVDSKEYGKLKIKATLDEVKDIVNTTLKEHIEKYGFKIHYYIGKSEIDLITWIFQQIHKNKTDFIGIWNMGFDIPHILDRMEINKVDPNPILCHPDVPDDFKYHRFKQDNSKVAHFTDKWHWFYLAGYTQFIDSINLYSRLRKVKGYLPSYKLDKILEKELSLNKLKLGPEGSHFKMQTERFLDYIAYNIFDTISLQMLEWKNTDITTMNILAGNTCLDDYSKQSVLVTNDVFESCRKHKKVTASASSNMKDEFSEYHPKVGGTVLPPERSIGVGVNALIERPDFETMLHVFVSDVDFSAYYPNTQCAANISKETKLDTGVLIEGKNVLATRAYYSNVISPLENAIRIFNKYYGLPNYQEMEDILLSYPEFR